MNSKTAWRHLIKIHDIGPIVAKNILSYFKDKYYKSNVDNLISSGINLIYQRRRAIKPLSVVITDFDDITRDLVYQIFLKLMDTKYQILYPRKLIF